MVDTVGIMVGMVSFPLSNPDFSVANPKDQAGMVVAAAGAEACSVLVVGDYLDAQQCDYDFGKRCDSRIPNPRSNSNVSTVQHFQMPLACFSSRMKSRDGPGIANRNYVQRLRGLGCLVVESIHFARIVRERSLAATVQFQKQVC